MPWTDSARSFLRRKFAEAILFLKIRYPLVNSPSIHVSITHPDQVLEDSVAALNTASVESLRKASIWRVLEANPITAAPPLYIDFSAISPTIPVQKRNYIWFTHMGQEIASSRHFDLIEDHAVVDSNADKYRAIGRFLGLMLATQTPVLLGRIPIELLKGLLGNSSAVPAKSNWRLIIDAFHDVVPYELFINDFWNVENLDRLLTGDSEFRIPDFIQLVNRSDMKYGAQDFQDLSWLERTLGDLSDGDRRRFLQKITGTNAIPSGGFVHMRADVAVFPEEYPGHISIVEGGIKIPRYPAETEYTVALLSFIYS